MTDETTSAIDRVELDAFALPDSPRRRDLLTVVRAAREGEHSRRILEAIDRVDAERVALWRGEAGRTP